MREEEKVKMLRCPCGQLIGVKSENSITSRHAGRKVEVVAGEGEREVKVRISCEKCGKKLEVSV